MAMKSGMLAAETLVDAMASDDFTSVTLGAYTELWQVRAGPTRSTSKSRNFTWALERVQKHAEVRHVAPGQLGPGSMGPA